MSMLDFLWHLCPFLCLITWPCLMYCVNAPSHCHYKLESPSDKPFPSSHEDVTPCRPAARLWVHRKGLEGAALGGTFLVCERGDSRQLCDPESTFHRQLKHKQAPELAGVARLLLQIIKQIKRGQRRRKTTIVYL